jgi:hypothetical protein
MCIYYLCHYPPHHFWAKPILVHFFSDFVEEKNIKDNKKDIPLLLVGDKDSDTERFLALLPCTCLLQSTLVHLYQTSSLLPGHLPKVFSANLRLFYLVLNREHINHIQVLDFLSFPYSSHEWPPLSV